MTPWFNLGDWTQARTFDDACEALAFRLAVKAGLDDVSVENLVDVGVGSGVQDALYAERFGLSIVGVEPGAVTMQNERFGSDNVRFLSGRGEALPVEDAGFDRVLALDCAYHFRTRAMFLSEAFRVLRPGGKLAAFDLAMTKPPSWKERALARLAGVPKENLWRVEDVYPALIDAGFVVESIEDVSSSVWPGLLRFAEDNPFGVGLSARGRLKFRTLYTALRRGPLPTAALIYVVQKPLMWL